jgi:ribonuclease HI
MKILAYCDGASFSTEWQNGDGLRRGPSGVGVAFYYEDRLPEDNFPPFDTLCIPIGIKTNNEAEYRAVIDAIEYWVLEMDHPVTFDHLVVRSDSQLIVNQINGWWKVKNDRLAEYHKRALFLIDIVNKADGKIDIEWIPRERNEQADILSKAAAGLAEDEVR